MTIGDWVETKAFQGHPWPAETMGPSPMSTTGQEQTQPSTSLSSMAKRPRPYLQRENSFLSNYIKRDLKTSNTSHSQTTPDLNRPRSLEGPMTKKGLKQQSLLVPCSCLQVHHHGPEPLGQQWLLQPTWEDS